MTRSNRKAQFSLVPFSRFLHSTRAAMRNGNWKAALFILAALLIVAATTIAAFS